MIAGPSTSTTTVLVQIGGSVSGSTGTAMTAATQCFTDTFSITGVAGSTPPIICGTNSGYHGNNKILVCLGMKNRNRFWIWLHTGIQILLF